MEERWKIASKEKKRSELRFQIWGDANICSQYEYDDYEDQENEKDESILWESSEHDIFWWDNYNKSNDCDDADTTLTSKKGFGAVCLFIDSEHSSLQFTAIFDT